MSEPVSPLKFLLVNGSLVLFLGLVVYFFLRRATRRNHAAWRTYAESRGLAFTPSRGFWFTWRSSRIEGSSPGGSPIAIDCFFQRVGRGPALFTRIRVGDREIVRDGLLSDPAELDRLTAQPPS